MIFFSILAINLVGWCETPIVLIRAGSLLRPCSRMISVCRLRSLWFSCIKLFCHIFVFVPCFKISFNPINSISRFSHPGLVWHSNLDKDQLIPDLNPRHRCISIRGVNELGRSFKNTILLESNIHGVSSLSSCEVNMVYISSEMAPACPLTRLFCHLLSYYW